MVIDFPHRRMKVVRTLNDAEDRMTEARARVESMLEQLDMTDEQRRRYVMISDWIEATERDIARHSESLNLHD